MFDALTIFAQDAAPAAVSNQTIGGVMGGTLFGALLLWLARVKIPSDDAAAAALRDRLFTQLSTSEAAREKSQDRFLQALAEADRKHADALALADKNCRDERAELRVEMSAKDDANRQALLRLEELISRDVKVTEKSAQAATDLAAAAKDHAQAATDLAGAVTSATRRKDGDSGIHSREAKP